MKNVYENSIYILKMNEIYNKSSTDFVDDSLSLGWCDSISIKKEEINLGNKEGLESVIDYFYKEKNTSKKENDITNNQMFFLFKDENVDTFFNNNNWNFQFVTFVYVKDKTPPKNTFNKKYSDYLKYENENLKIFDTLDNASFIAITRSLKYKEGLQNVLNLSFGISDNYCFTSVCLNNKYHEVNQVERLNLKINFSINDYSNFYRKEKLLFPQNFRHTNGYHLGNKDGYYSYSKVTVENIYDIYNDLKENIASISEFSISINSSITIDEEFLELKERVNTVSTIDNTNERKRALQQIKNSLSDIKDNLIYVLELKYNLLYLISNLNKMVHLKYCDYAYLSIFPSLNILKDNFGFLINNNVSKYELRNLYSYIRNAEKLIDLVSNSSYHTAHDTILKYEHNEICGKIVTFYNVYLNKLVKEISTNCNNEYRYSFLVVPQLCTHIVVKVINDENLKNNGTLNPGDRVLLVKIPVNDIYNIPDVLISLTHESGHFIGNEMRCRKSRFKYLNIILANIVLNSFFKGIINEQMNSEQIKGIHIIQELLYETTLSKCEFYEKKFENENKGNNDLLYYLANYDKYILKNIIKDINEEKNGILSKLGSYYEDIILANNNSQLVLNSIELIKDFKNKINLNSYYFINRTKKSLYFDMHSVLKIMRECYADLFAIKLLGIDCDNYLKELYNNHYKIGKIDINKSFYLRAALICEVLEWDTVKNQKNYNIITDINDIRGHLNNIKCINEKSNVEILRPFNLGGVWLNTVNYLKECRDLFEQESNNSMKNCYNLFKELNEVNFNENYLSHIMNIINREIDDFREHEESFYYYE